MEYIQRNPEKSFVYATPFLAEIRRVIERCGRFKQPRNYTGKKGEEHACQKIEDFNNLLLDGEDIAVTHCTFLKATEDTISRIRDGGYVLILDEVLDIIVEYNKIEHPIRPKTIPIMVDKGLIRIRDDLRVEWIEEKEYGDSDFSAIEEMAKKGILYCVDGKLFLSIFPPEIFSAFSEVYILTYMFEGSMFHSYLKMFGIEHCIKTVSNANGDYVLSQYDVQEDMEWRERIGQLIQIYEPKDKYEFRAKALSKSWYDRKGNTAELSRLKSGMRAFFLNAKSRDIMWTCPKEYQKRLKFAGINESRTSKEKESIKAEQERMQIAGTPGIPADEPKSYECFVPCNAKATNDFNDRTVLAYCCNMYMNPEINKFFDKHGVNVDNEVFALSCLVQWIWRSAIRNPTPSKIVVYIPSNRMRTILAKWLHPQNRCTP